MCGAEFIHDYEGRSGPRCPDCKARMGAPVEMSNDEDDFDWIEFTCTGRGQHKFRFKSSEWTLESFAQFFPPSGGAATFEAVKHWLENSPESLAIEDKHKGEAALYSHDEVIDKIVAFCAKCPESCPHRASVKQTSECSCDCNPYCGCVCHTPAQPKPELIPAIRSAINFMLTVIVPRRCDNEAVADCWRCKSVFLAAEFKKIIDAGATPPAASERTLDEEQTEATNRIFRTYGKRLDLFFHDAQNNHPWGYSVKPPAASPQPTDAERRKILDDLAKSEVAEGLYDREDETPPAASGGQPSAEDLADPAGDTPASLGAQTGPRCPDCGSEMQGGFFRVSQNSTSAIKWRCKGKDESFHEFIIDCSAKLRQFFPPSGGATTSAQPEAVPLGTLPPIELEVAGVLVSDGPPGSGIFGKGTLLPRKYSDADWKGAAQLYGNALNEIEHWKNLAIERERQIEELVAADIDDEPIRESSGKSGAAGTTPPEASGGAAQPQRISEEAYAECSDQAVEYLNIIENANYAEAEVAIFELRKMLPNLDRFIRHEVEDAAGATPPAASPTPIEADNYVAWCRYVHNNAGETNGIRLCDSDSPGAFKVYRHPTPPAASPQGGRWFNPESQLRWLKLLNAARRIRHWHDSGNEGMVVSSEHVRGLWEELMNFEDIPNVDYPTPPAASGNTCDNPRCENGVHNHGSGLEVLCPAASGGQPSAKDLAERIARNIADRIQDGDRSDIGAMVAIIEQELASAPETPAPEAGKEGGK